MNLANMLLRSGHKVTIWSSGFYHQEKRHRSRRYEVVAVSELLEIRLIPSSGYRRNVGLSRLVDHAQIAYNLRRTLTMAQELPDVAFVGYPPIEFAWIALRWLRKNGVPALLDIKDNWPEFFITPFPEWLKPIARIAFSPYFFLGRRTIAEADGICSMTPSFLSWARSFASRSDAHYDGVFPLTPAEFHVSEDSISVAYEWWRARGVNADGRARFLFVGSLSGAFDFDTIAKVADRALREREPWQFVICGAGGAEADVRRLFDGLSNVIMPGWVDRAQLRALADISLAGLAPYRNLENFTNNMPNKIVDYLALSLPIITPLSGEVSDMIMSSGSGVIYDEGDIDSLYAKVHLLASDLATSDLMANNARATYDRSYEHDKVYGGLVSHLLRMADRQNG